MARLAVEPAAVIVEIMNADGTMARRDDLERFAQDHQLKIGTIADLIHYRSVKERTVEYLSTSTVNTRYGDFELSRFRDLASDDYHFAMHIGDISADETTGSWHVLMQCAIW